MIDKNEFKRSEYEYREFRDSLPEGIKKTFDGVFDLLSPFVNYIFPAREELCKLLTGLIKKQFPELNTVGKPYLAICINDIAQFISESLASGLFTVLRDIEAGIQKESQEEFERHLRLYARPHIPKIETLADYEMYQGFTHEEKIELVEEANEASIAECDEYNEMKSAFLDVIQPVLFKHYGALLENLNTEGWERFGISVGFPFYCYRDDCFSLLYYLEKGLINEDPGVNFYQYRLDIAQKLST